MCEENLQKDLFNRINSIPEKICKSMYKRAMEDTIKLNLYDQESEEFKKIAYALYRSYCVGFVLGNIEKISRNINI